MLKKRQIVTVKSEKLGYLGERAATRSLTTWGGGRVEDILIYLMEFSSPSQIYVNISITTPGFQKELLSPSLEMLLVFHPPPSEYVEF